MANIQERTDRSLKDLTIIKEHTPSWKAGQTGTARLSAAVHAEAGWATLCVSESYESPDTGKFVFKEVIMTLDSAERKALIRALQWGGR